MKTITVVALFIGCAAAGIVKRQASDIAPSVTDELENGRVCFHGENGNYTEQICPESEQYCQTTIRVENDNIQINAMCKQDQACFNNQENNLMNCIDDESLYNEVQTCTFCCEDDLCNNEYDLDTLLLIASQFREPPTVATFDLN